MIPPNPAPPPQAPGDSFAGLLRGTTEGYETAFDVVRELLPGQPADGEAGAEPPATRTILSVERRKLQPEPAQARQRAESAARAHEFHTADGLAAYLGRYAGPDTTVWIDAPGQKIHAILNERAEQGIETLRLIPQTHPRLKPWLDMLDQAASLEMVVEFLARNRRMVQDSEPLLHALSQIRASTTIRLDRTAGRKSNTMNGLVVETKIQGQTESLGVDLPETLRVDSPIYVGADEVTLEVDLTIKAVEGGTKLMASLSCPDLAIRRLQAFDAFAETIGAAIEKDAPDGAVITVLEGRPEHRQWDYVEDPETE